MKTPVPCWHCQRDDEEAHVIDHGFPKAVMAVKCTQCGQRGPCSGNWDDVYLLWNQQQAQPHRIDADAVAKQLAELILERQRLKAGLQAIVAHGDAVSSETAESALKG